MVHEKDDKNPAMAVRHVTTRVKKQTINDNLF